MSESQNRPAWMDDELVKEIPQEKLDLLHQMFAEANQNRETRGRSMNQKEMLMHFMPLIKQIRSANLSFTPQEMQAAIAAIKKHSTAQELDEINRILSKTVRTD